MPELALALLFSSFVAPAKVNQNFHSHGAQTAVLHEPAKACVGQLQTPVTSHACVLAVRHEVAWPGEMINAHKLINVQGPSLCQLAAHNLAMGTMSHTISQGKRAQAGWLRFMHWHPCLGETSLGTEHLGGVEPTLPTKSTWRKTFI